MHRPPTEGADVTSYLPPAKDPGLTSQEAVTRPGRDGGTTLPQRRPTPGRDPAARSAPAGPSRAAVLTIATGDLTDAPVIVFVIVVNPAVGVIQEVKARSEPGRLLRAGAPGTVLK